MKPSQPKIRNNPETFAERPEEVLYVCEGGSGDEANITVQLRTKFPGIGGAIFTYQALPVAFRTDFDYSPQCGHRIFYKHAVIKKLEEKMRKGQFTLEDFLEQLRQMKKLGSLESIVGMLLGGAEMMKQADMTKQEKQVRRMEGMICSMTPQERRSPQILNARRRQRIAKGSGVHVAELNTLLSKFNEMQQVMKKMGKFQKMLSRMGGGAGNLLRPR